MRFYYALSLGREVHPTARLVGSREGRCGSIVLSVFRRVSRQADRRGRSRTVWWSRREMMVFPALARMVEFWWNGNALRTCEPGRRKGLGRRSGGVGIGAVNGDETEGLGAVGVNPVAATEGLKPLERLGPAQMERSDNIAIPLCESGRDGVQSSGTPAVTVSRLRSPSEDVSVA